MKRIILFGAPGSGKGTQADKIEREFSFKKISTGDLIRAEVHKKSVIGNKIEEFSSRGLLVPDEIIIEMVKNRVLSDDIKEGYILDGFPRTLDQVKGLSTVPAEEEMAVFLRVNEDIIVKRILSRVSCENCGNIFNTIFQIPAKVNVCDNCGSALTKRNDDTEDIIKKRIVIYRAETLPVINYYRGKGNLHELDASKDINTVWKEIRELVK
ncbi:MAG: nucleoside monophosphate kinase [Candidatus Aminicenantes bacterium]|nr:nucleoside monophosphate kinase [Candidatus Aminicenantes bacterium]MCK5005533.1 nucleoside monophosphate kinase [Candidatus Aminicenantes bacterium]